jgi:hypothetical protein
MDPGTRKGMTLDRAKKIAQEQLEKHESKFNISPCRDYDMHHGVEKVCKLFSRSVESFTEEEMEFEISQVLDELQKRKPERMSGPESPEHVKDTVSFKELRLTFIDGGTGGFRIQLCYYPAGAYDWGDNKTSETVVSVRRKAEK